MTQIEILNEIAMLANVPDENGFPQRRMAAVVLAYSPDLSADVALCISPIPDLRERGLHPRSQSATGTVFPVLVEAFPPQTWRIYPLDGLQC